jgi:hypothetical protein
MKINRKFIVAVALSVAAVPAFAAVSVSVGEPGFYGNIDLGGGPPPVVYNSAPVVSGAVVVGAPPVYLRVPPDHRAHWERHCAEYNACGRPAYFVHDDWYRQHYARR